MKFDDPPSGFTRLHTLHRVADFCRATAIGKKGLALVKLLVRKFTGEAMKRWPPLAYG